MRKKLFLTVLTLGILGLAAFFRFYGINWDQNQHLHPDERFLTMVAGAISWPRDIFEYLDTETSPLNPHNRGFGFFVYGTFPLFFTKWIAEFLNKGDYNQLTIIGRQLSALFDLGTVALVFLIARNVIPTERKRVEGSLANARRNLLKLIERFLAPLGMTITNNWIFPLLSMFLYSVMVLPIQLSHFFAVDTYLTFFLTLSFYILVVILNLFQDPMGFRVKPGMTNYSILNSKFLILNSILGISFGLALASKISAVLFLPIIILFFTYTSFRINNFNLKKKIFDILYVFFIFNILFFIFTYLTFRLAQPYVFATGNIFDISLNQKVLDNWRQLKSFDDPNAWFPPAVQWIKTKPYIFPLKNMIFWGLGLPLGIISISAVIFTIVRSLDCYIVRLKNIFHKQSSNYSNIAIEKISNNRQLIILTLITLWIITLFLYQGIQFSKTMRYFYPIYPFLAIISAYFIVQVFDKFRVGLLTLLVLLMLLLIYPLSFISIYSRPHSRVAASEWIYKNVPPGSYISSELWDDGLPLNLGSRTSSIYYQTVEFPLYNNDTAEKWKEMDIKLKKVDYIFLTSNRLYGSISTVPEKYPITNRYYQSLFDGSLGFEKAAEFTSRPNLPLSFIKLCLTPPFIRYGIAASKTQECPLPGISFVDDYADETFTVYDHPKVTIFKKIKSVDYLRLLNLNL